MTWIAQVKIVCLGRMDYFSVTNYVVVDQKSWKLGLFVESFGRGAVIPQGLRLEPPLPPGSRTFFDPSVIFSNFNTFFGGQKNVTLLLSHATNTSSNPRSHLSLEKANSIYKHMEKKKKKFPNMEHFILAPPYAFFARPKKKFSIFLQFLESFLS